MSELTPNLKLFKYNTETDAKQPFSINDCMNANWDKIDAKCGSGNNLLDFKWSDHLLNDMSWLRADTFSWQSGTTYSLVYNELLTEYNNSASTTETDGSITFKRTPKGYKIALATQETAIAEKYATDGIAWYYILDTTNKKFKLPRTKFGFEGIRDSVGNDITESLPNITGDIYAGEAYGSSIFTSSSGAFQNGSNTGWRTNTVQSTVSGASDKVFFDASRSSSTYQDGAPVQERATQMYLYFYVGEFTKSAEAQTAGLNSELLNGKVDTSSLAECQVVTETYINGTSGYRIWSDGYCEQWGYQFFLKGGTILTLLKEMKDTNYMITYDFVGAAANSYGEGISVTARTTTSFTAHGYHSSAINDEGANWKVTGYLAQGEY